MDGTTRTMKKGLLSTKNLVLMAMFSALGGVLMYFEFPLPFIAPPFYELDLSEIPILVGTFMLGPVAGVIMEAVKVLIKLLLKGTSTGYVGDLANFCIGCTFLLPAGLIYFKKKTRKQAMVGMAVGTLCMTVVGVILNVYVMIPFYTAFMPLEQILEAGKAINPAISNVWTFAILAVGPFNLIKGLMISVITLLIYKKIRVLLRMN